MGVVISIVEYFAHSNSLIPVVPEKARNGCEILGLLRMYVVITKCSVSKFHLDKNLDWNKGGFRSREILE